MTRKPGLEMSEDFQEEQTYDGRIIIRGRPDFGNWGFGWTVSKKHPPYVFGNTANSMLVHKVNCVKLHWYELIDGGHSMLRLTSPKRLAETVCGTHFFLSEKRAKLCMIPQPDAAFCGRCHGDSPTFSRRFRKWKNGELERAKMRAKDTLGCMEEGWQ
jgi:hypothetical protein